MSETRPTVVLSLLSSNVRPVRPSLSRTNRAIGCAAIILSAQLKSRSLSARLHFRNSAVPHSQPVQSLQPQDLFDFALDAVAVPSSQAPARSAACAYRHKGHSVLHLISDEEFSRGMRQMDEDAKRGPVPSVGAYTYFVPWPERTISRSNGRPLLMDPECRRVNRAGDRYGVGCRCSSA